MSEAVAAMGGSGTAVAPGATLSIDEVGSRRGHDRAERRDGDRGQARGGHLGAHRACSPKGTC